MIANSEVKMAQPFNPAAPIEDLFEQINNGQDLVVAAGLPFLDTQLATKAYDLIYKTGFHNNVCKKWNCCLAVDRAYTNLQDHFTQVHRELHQLQSAAQKSGYTINN
eukprot:14994627-Ditylum_brightwellii.AAC.1